MDIWQYIHLFTCLSASFKKHSLFQTWECFFSRANFIAWNMGSFPFFLVPGEPPHLQCANMKVVLCGRVKAPCNSPFLYPNKDLMCYEKDQVDTCPVSCHSANISSVSLSDVLKQTYLLFCLRVILVVEWYTGKRFTVYMSVVVNVPVADLLLPWRSALIWIGSSNSLHQIVQND